MQAELVEHENLPLGPAATIDFHTPAELNKSPFVSDETVGPAILDSAEKQSTLIKDSVYYMDTVVFKVGYHLFKVPTHYFKQGSSFFVQNFGSLDTGKVDGNSERFIELEDVTPDEFRALLKYMYPIQSNCLQQVPPTPTTDEWITILKLSTQWMMLDIRRVAIGALSSATILPVDRVVLAREYKVNSWLRSAYLELAETASSMTQEDMEKIGLTAAFKIHKARERYMTAPRAFDQSPRWISSAPPSSLPRANWEENNEDYDDLFRIQKATVKRSAVERVPLSRDYGVAEWLCEAFIELVKRHEPLTVDESQTLGFDTAIRLYSARERRLFRDIERSPTPSRNTPVDEELWKELGALDTCQPVERVILAQKYGVMEWLHQAFVDLMERPEALSVPEAKTLGYETAIRLAIARETYIRRINTGNSRLGWNSTYSNYNITDSNIRTLVDEELASELSAISSYGPVDRVLVARKAGVEEWLQSAFHELVQQKEMVTDEEAVALGLDTCIQLSRFRLNNFGNHSTTPSWTDPSHINAEFEMELSEIREAGEGYTQPGPESELGDDGIYGMPVKTQVVTKTSKGKAGKGRKKKPS